MRVYPRACGGTITWTPSADHCSGLSPRMRGNLWHWGLHVFRIGSIPAHAGEPAAVFGLLDAITVYPRACGGTGLLVASGVVIAGLSPRMRGNLPVGMGGGGGGGSIPAHAGEPYSHHKPPGLTRVYPRACGGTVSVLSWNPTL